MLLRTVLRTDLDAAKTRYRALAERYDFATRRMEPVRRDTIVKLGLKRGDRVLDIASGTGKSFELLRDAVGPEGEVVAIEPVAEMMSQARERVKAADWHNVSLIERAAEDAPLEPHSFDAALFMYAQDVLQSERALERIGSALKPRARVGIAGFKLMPWWTGLANAYLLAVSWRYFTSFRNLHRPWALLDAHVPDLRVHATFFGSGYMGHGHHRS